MILSRRRIIRNKDDKLPYDAEIEYLESTGTSGFYIDTGIGRPSNFTSVEIVLDIQFNSTAGRQIMGATTAVTIGVNANRWEGGYNEYKGTADTNRHTLSKRMWVASNKSYFSMRVDNTDYSLKNYDYSDAHFSSDISLFNHAVDSSIGTNCKIYRAKVYVNDRLVFDGIPVRVCQVGYLYDRVSKKLFGNAGSGAFALGQDIVEVEYLESSGAPYIDTGVYITKSTTIEISHQVIALYADVSADIQYFGCWTSNSQCAYCFRTGSNAIRTRWGSSSNTDLSVSKNDMILFTVDGTQYVNKNVTKNTTKSANTGSSYPTNQTFRLFAGAENRPVRIYYAKVGNLDLIPVRVGTTGYMLDKVEHKLYGNAGSGDFIIGATKAKHYIHNGLIAMWDGIENAGYDTHTSDETKMVELISGNPATIEQDVVWSSGQSAFDSSRTITEKGIATSANNKYIDITFPFTFSGDAWTIEMVQVITTRRTTNVCDALNKAKPWGNVFEIHHYSNTFRIKTSNVSEWNSSQSIVTGVNCWTIRKSTDNIVNLFKNGAWVASANSKNYNLGLITNYISFTNSGHHGVLYAFRIYNRILAGTEVVYNYNVDKLRFGL